MSHAFSSLPTISRGCHCNDGLSAFGFGVRCFPTWESCVQRWEFRSSIALPSYGILGIETERCA